MATTATVGRVESIHFSVDGPHTATIDIGGFHARFASVRCPCFERGDLVAVGRAPQPVHDDGVWQGHRHDQHFVLCVNADFGLPAAQNEVTRLPAHYAIGARVPFDLGEIATPRTMHVFPNWASDCD